jgi:hypothetical protein
MTFCFTCLSILIQTGLLHIIGQPFLLSWQWFKNDLFVVPLQNALYAAFAFTLPSLVISQAKRRFFLLRIMKRRKS